ncbi:MAG: molecular chaperone TorD family protein [Rhizobiaceae bacterium]
MTRVDVKTIEIDAEDRMRADLYGLLSRVLFSRPDQSQLAHLSALSGDDSDMGRAFNALAKVASATASDVAGEEYDGLFIGMGRGELLPYGSYYLTGFLNEKPLAKLRNSMGELGIKRQDDVKEPEDHIGSLMEMMSNLIVGNYGEPATMAVQREFFAAHIEPWAGHFFKDLEAAELSRLYQPVGAIGRLFVEIETRAFSMD